MSDPPSSYGVRKCNPTPKPFLNIWDHCDISGSLSRLVAKKSIFFTGPLGDFATAWPVEMRHVKFPL